MHASGLRDALSSPPPRSLEGAAPYLARARFSYRLGMAGALLFCIPFFVMVVTGETSMDRIVGGLIGIALVWLLPPVLFLRFRMRHINRLWCEGRLVPGVLEGFRPPPHLRGAISPETPGYFLVSFQSPGGQARAAIFIGEFGDFPKGSVPHVLVVDDIEHRAGLMGSRQLLVAPSATGEKAARMLSGYGTRP